MAIDRIETAVFWFYPYAPFWVAPGKDSDQVTQKGCQFSNLPAHGSTVGIPFSSWRKAGFKWNIITRIEGVELVPFEPGKPAENQSSDGPAHLQTIFSALDLGSYVFSDSKSNGIGTGFAH